MTFTDTHTHPYYNEDATGFVQRAIDAGVTRMIMPNVDAESIHPMKKLCAQFPDNLRMAMGLHPTEVKENADKVLETVAKELFSGEKYVAVGEIGIDLYWDITFREKQMEIFDMQLNMAEKMNLPVIIHCRNGLDETLEVLGSHKGLSTVFHSFGGTTVDVERILSAGDNNYIGINGIITFKNSSLKDVVPAIPSERLLLETDSPYLAPVPYRGRLNESAYLPYIAKKIAESLKKDVEEVAETTTENSHRLFGF